MSHSCLLRLGHVSSYSASPPFRNSSLLLSKVKPPLSSTTGSCLLQCFTTLRKSEFFTRRKDLRCRIIVYSFVKISHVEQHLVSGAHRYKKNYYLASYTCVLILGYDVSSYYHPVGSHSVEEDVSSLQLPRVTVEDVLRCCLHRLYVHISYDSLSSTFIHIFIR